MSSAKTLARRCAVQALYQWQVSGNAIGDIENQFIGELAAAKSLHKRSRGGGALTSAEQDLLEELIEKFCRLKDSAAESLPVEPTLAELVANSSPPDVDLKYFSLLLHEVPGQLDEVDRAIGDFADRPVAEIDPVERAILRISGYELLFRPELPYRVVLNEGIDLAKHFGATQSHRYINGILDRVARKHRSAEQRTRNSEPG